ncbi:MAG: acetaldehyde dehydrogenase (acetylating) [Actinomycetota bacterium]|nr:acetaldehyde dehydrogenase (acetylating) [Actinomycetota bacterium]
MHKVLACPDLDLVALVGVDPGSDGLARARSLGVATSADGVDYLLARREEIALMFEATSAYVHLRHHAALREAGIVAVDLTPAAVGPKVVPTVNLHEHLERPNVNLITCGGQATAPIVAAVAAVTRVPYAEIVSTVSSRSAGPGTRQNIDEFTRTTAAALTEIGGAEHGKAIIVLNPADPPILMRNTIYCALPDEASESVVEGSVREMVAQVQEFVPGYRLKADPVFDVGSYDTPGGRVSRRVAVLLEVEGAGDYLPPYAGNLDIMTAAAVRVGRAFAAVREGVPA